MRHEERARLALMLLGGDAMTAVILDTVDQQLRPDQKSLLPS